MLFQVAKPERQRRLFRSFDRVLDIGARFQPEAAGEAPVGELLLEDASLLFFQRCAGLVTVLAGVEVRVVGRELFLRSVVNGVQSSSLALEYAVSLVFRQQLVKIELFDKRHRFPTLDHDLARFVELKNVLLFLLG